jgi:hypothetical protein
MDTGRDTPSRPDSTTEPVAPAAADAAPDSSHDIVTRFLADSDVPCPRCGYNLRGVEQPVCPECGEALSLTISRQSTVGLRDGDFRLFFLLGFGWPFLAGILNGVRALRQAHAIATFYGTRTNYFGSGWDAVEWTVWLRISWSVYLTVAGLVGLIVTWRYWSRPCPVQRRNKLTHTCLFVFFVYLAWHAVWFFVEL